MARQLIADNIAFMRGWGSIGVFLCLALTAGFVYAHAGQNQDSASSANPHPVLVELFTSEGCSSCPPADALLQRLDEFQPIRGAQLIVLSEHVTYWDQDGWKDPNSSQALTLRQKDYQLSLGGKDVFTPQLIVDGTHEVQMRQVPQMEAVLNQARDTPKIPVSIADVAVDPADPTILHARIETGAAPDKHHADVYVALALGHVESQVLKGENGGKHLVHVAVVQELTKVGKLSKEKAFTQDVKLKLKPGTDRKNVRIIAFVQESGPGKMLGAAMRQSAE